MSDNKFVLTTKNFSDTQTELERRLQALNVEQKDNLRAQLLVEEIFLRMSNRGGFDSVNVHVDKNFFGKVRIELTAKGDAYNPLFEVTDVGENDEDYYSAMILKGNRQRLNWSHKRNVNVVTIGVSGESNRLLRMTLAGMVGGIIFGFVMREFFSQEMISFVMKDLAAPIQEMFVNALNMIIAPVIFFSVVSGIVGMSEGANVGKIGSKLIGMYLSTSIIASIVGIAMAMIFFSGDVEQVTATVDGGGIVQPVQFSMLDFIVNIIPGNLVSPIVEGNMLQMIFVAVLFGLGLNALGDKVRPLREIVLNLTDLFTKILSFIIIFVPLIVFFAIISPIVDANIEILVQVSRSIVAMFANCLVMFGVYLLLIRFVAKLNPLPFLKKVPEVWTMPLTTSSSMMSMPFTMKICTDKLGVSPKIASFAIPIGTTINMDGTCICMPLVVIMFLKMYGMDVDFNSMLIIFVMTLSMSVGMPGVPNAGVACIISILNQLGFSADVAGIIFCIGVVLDRAATCTNVTGDVAVSMILSRTENLLDEKIYFRD